MIKRIRRNEKGQGMVEYGLILALVSVVAIGALSGLGGQVSDKFDEVVEVMEYTEIDKKITEEGYIPISTPEELNSLRDGKEQTFGRGTKWEKEYTSGLNKKYIQVSDIDLSGIDNFEPIGDNGNLFTGVFDGGGYVINNLTVDKGDEDFAGLFGRAEGSTLTNIGLVSVDVKGHHYIGGLVGRQDSSRVSNSYATGKVTGTGIYVGGLVGVQDSSSISKSYATGEAAGNSHIGGLVGYQGSSSEISNSYTTGKVTGASEVGGLVGYQGSSSIGDSYATGKVNGANNIGGLVGYNNIGSSVKNSGWASDVNTTGVGSNYGSSTNTKGYSKAEIDKMIEDLIEQWSKE